MRRATITVLLSVLILGSVLSPLLFAQDAKQKTDKVFQGETLTLRVDGLSCPFCAYGLEKKLKSLRSVESLDVKINTGVIHLKLKKNASVQESELRKKVNEAGFTLREIQAGEKK